MRPGRLTRSERDDGGRPASAHEMMCAQEAIICNLLTGAGDRVMIHGACSMTQAGVSPDRFLDVVLGGLNRVGQSRSFREASGDGGRVSATGPVCVPGIDARCRIFVPAAFMQKDIQGFAG